MTPVDSPQLKLTRQQARNLHLAAQGLLVRPRGRPVTAAVVAAIARMQLLQIDTINIVARSPYLVLFSRLGAYPKRWLDRALEDGKLFECWAHEACYAPIGDYPLHRRHVAGMSNHWALKRARRMRAEHAASMDALLARIREIGPVKASDFERKTAGSGGWWGWKVEKRWLEAWFALGELMILRRENFQRVYDLRERVLAGIARRSDGLRHLAVLDDAGLPTREEVRLAFIRKAVLALGVAQARWIADYFRSGRKFKEGDLEALVDSGELLRVDVDDWDAPGYVHRDCIELTRAAARDELRATHTTLLSPFDPIVWDRARAKAMFDFDYRLECYTPGPKRRFGYFVLPILHRGQLVGRLDAKAHRNRGEFEVKALYLETGVRASKVLARALARAIRSCAAWHDTPTVKLRRSEPREFAATLRAALAA